MCYLGGGGGLQAVVSKLSTQGPLVEVGQVTRLEVRGQGSQSFLVSKEAAAG